MNTELGEKANKSFPPHITNRRPVKLTRSMPQKIVNRLDFLLLPVPDHEKRNHDVVWEFGMGREWGGDEEGEVSLRVT
jgi:hypothetical protein